MKSSTADLDSAELLSIEQQIEVGRKQSVLAGGIKDIVPGF